MYTIQTQIHGGWYDQYTRWSALLPSTFEELTS